MQQGAGSTLCFSTSPLWLSSLPEEGYGEEKKRRAQECSRAGEDLLSRSFWSRDQKRGKSKKKTGRKESENFSCTIFRSEKEDWKKEERHRDWASQASSAGSRVENEVKMPPVALVWLKNSVLDSAWLPRFPQLFDQHFNTNGFQEEVGWAEGVAQGPAVLHPGWCICRVWDVWARASHHQGAFLRVVEEAQLQRGVHQEGGAQLSAATGKMFRGYTGPLYMFPQRLINDPGAGREMGQERLLSGIRR